MLWNHSQVEQWLFPTTVGSSIAWLPTFWRGKAMMIILPSGSGSKVTSKLTRRIRWLVWAKKHLSLTVFTASLRATNLAHICVRERSCKVALSFFFTSAPRKSQTIFSSSWSVAQLVRVIYTLRKEEQHMVPPQEN